MPTKALVNDLYIGVIPNELDELTCIEESLIARAHVKCSIYKINGVSNGLSQMKMRGNIITFPQNPDKIINILPTLPNSETIKIVFCGDKRPSTNDLKHLFTVRRENVKSALLRLKQCNKLYADVIISEENLNLLNTNDVPQIIMENIIYINDQNSEYSTNQNYVNCNEQINQILTHDEFEANCLLANSNTNLTLIEQYNKLMENTKLDDNQDKILFIPHSTCPMIEFDVNHLLFSFPTLFPYGIGGIDGKKMNYRDHVVYLMNQSSNRFRTHKSFMFVTFNIIQRNEARKNINLMIKRKDYEQFAISLRNLTLEQLQDAQTNILKHENMNINSNIHSLLKKV
jgi:hypothetical protein